MRFFNISAKLKDNKLGRAGILETPHGRVETPAFVAVGTKATVKSLTPAQIKETGAPVVLGNTYHLYLEPGERIVEEAGGIGKFMGWDGPTMTDSGGFQVFSLGAAFGAARRSKIRTQRRHTNKLENVSMLFDETLVKIDEDGVTFKSYKDGSEHRFTPERSIEIQRALGADIIFVFDECVSPDASYEYQKEAMERTHRWARRSLEANRRLTQMRTLIDADNFNPRTSAANQRVSALFGIVQGGRFEDLRKESARTIGEMDFDGFGIGGSFEKKDIDATVGLVNRILPEEKPRHLLGIGGVSDLFAAVENGCDLFDCVAPTREARTGSLYTKRGRINITNARFRADFSPLEENCTCYSCRNFTKAYLAHLFRAQELLAYTLASIHNLSFFIGLVTNMRNAILDGGFINYKKDFLSQYEN